MSEPSPSFRLIPSADAACPVTPVTADGLDVWAAAQPETTRRWLTATDWRAKPGTVHLVPGSDGGLAGAVLGVSAPTALRDWGALPGALPPGDYRIAGVSGVDGNQVALGWALGAYRFDRYKSDAAEGKPVARLVWPEDADRDRVLAAAEATWLARDLINTPASDMGPANLAEAAEALALRFGATCSVTVGDDLLSANYPAVHTVGRAGGPGRAPRLIDMVWGDPGAPKVTLVGKGVCFDTGGLDIKPASAMKLMKKDMGGAANMLGAALMIMAAGLKVRLRLLIPAVENSVSGDAMRPMDVVTTRAGKTVEIGHTDAEGRVILADALTEAASESPDLLVDFATLTGAARVALGTDLPALFTDDDGWADAFVQAGRAEDDPLWRMPLWAPYRGQIDGKVADITNDAESGYGGAITAGLFLKEFTRGAKAWAHVDLMAWNLAAKPGRPLGGEAMGMRAVVAAIAERFGR